jgi:aspartyl-tRNA(Asn)/glutamyl-tRNA(Gln) amidotransferase subunit A
LDGIVPLSSTLDTVGPLARRVSDVAVALSVCAGQNLNASGAVDPGGTDFLKQFNRSVQGWRVGVPVGGFFRKVQPPVGAAFENTLKVLRDLKCQLIDFEPPGIEVMSDLFMVIIRAEGAAYHERYRGQEHLYGPSFRERVFQGREISALAYIAALQQRHELRQNWSKLCSMFDVLVVPSGPAVAPPHGATTIDVEGEHFPFRELLGRFSRPFNLIGWPALSIPNGIDAQGLPIGLQIVGPPESEARLLTLGHQVEQTLGLTDKLGIQPRYAA